MNAHTRLTPVTGAEAVAMYATMPDRLRNARAMQIVESITDPDMLVRIIRAAANELTMFDPGCTILACCDEIDREIIAEDEGANAVPGTRLPGQSVWSAAL